MSETKQLVGERIKRLRQFKGWSRQEIANRLHVDVTAVAAWEQGKYLPRDGHRVALAAALATSVESLFLQRQDADSTPLAAQLVDTMEDLPQLLLGLVERARISVKAIRLSAPYATAAYVQEGFRARLAQRVLDHSIEAMRVEIFYDLTRVKEVLSNIFRYDGCRYYVKAYCSGLKEIVPAMGAYFFDDSEFVLGGYWSGVPPHGKPGLRLSGAPIQSYLTAYWDEIWRRGTLLNLRGPHDLDPLRQIALSLGLEPGNWPNFVEEARWLEIGDGAPPLL